MNHSILKVLTRTKQTVLVAGNPNAGKTSLFNALAGVRARTANYAGVTVELRRASISVAGLNEAVELIDLPGLYGMDPTSPEEEIAASAIRSVLATDGIVLLVLDSTQLTRQLFLAEQLRTVGTSMVIALNCIDLVNHRGLQIDHGVLSETFQSPVVRVSARAGEGIDELKTAVANELQKTKERKKSQQRNRAVSSCTDGCTGCHFAARHQWAEQLASKVVIPRNGLPIDTEKSPSLSKIDAYLTSPVIGGMCLMLVMIGMFLAIFLLADVPMSLIESAFGKLKDFVGESLPKALSPMLRIPTVFVISLLITMSAFWFNGTKWTTRSGCLAIGIAAALLALPMEDFRSLLLEGLIAGVAGVLVFLPQICILFVMISLLEDSGYMARGAFVMERVMKRVGLPGQAFVPMLSAHACAIPAMMATRSIANWRDRLVTILVLPQLTCSARLPVYAMLSTLLFAGQPLMAAATFAGAYLLGLSSMLFTAWLLKQTILPGESSPMIIELPSYRIPSIKNALLSAMDRAFAFLKTAGSTILLISCVLWFASTYPKIADSDRERLLASGQSEAQVRQIEMESSMAGRIGKSLEPVFAPLGFDWRMNIGVLTSFAAREVFVSTLAIVYGVGESEDSDSDGLVATLRDQKRPNGKPTFDMPTSFSLLVFYVLAMQCLPTQVVTKRETGSWRWAAFQFAFMTIWAYAAAWLTYTIANGLMPHN